MKILKAILIWLIGIMFMVTGLAKLLGLDDMSAALFSKAGYPSWLYYVVAGLEMAGGILLISKRSRRLGAATIASVMIGAIGTHLLLGDHFGHTVVPALIILFSYWIVKTEK